MDESSNVKETIETEVKIPLVSFKLPVLPPSMNQIYQILYNQRRVILKPEVLQYKSQMKMFVPRFEVKQDEHLGIALEIHGHFLYKNGSIKRIDAPNLFKVIVDLIAEKMAFDDSQFYKFKVIKIQDEEEYVYATVYKL